MKSSKKLSFEIIIFVIVSCIIMAIIETIIEPTYLIKSIMKIIFFFIIPIIFMKVKKISISNNKYILNKKNIIKLLLLGIGIYSIIMIGFALTKGIFDYTSLVNSLSTDQNVSSNNFLLVASYISFGNSLLEEFMFRNVSFLVLSKYTLKKYAYLFSSIMFSIYHVFMFTTSFPVPLIILSLIGLAIGGLIFNYVDDRDETMYNSWIIHMFADFAIMTIWYMHI